MSAHAATVMFYHKTAIYPWKRTLAFEIDVYMMFEMTSLCCGIGMKNDPSWRASPSKVASHFGTGGLAVAVATGVTHALGFQISQGASNLTYNLHIFFQLADLHISVEIR
ncbi:hypothetical protein Tco_0812436 [Tanacetum coccineum]